MSQRLGWVLGGALVLMLVVALLWRVTQSRASRDDLTAVRDVQDATAAITHVIPAAMRSAQVPAVAVAVTHDLRRVFRTPAY